MKTVIGKFETIAQRFVWIGGAMLILAALTVTVDVFARKLFGISMAGSDELSGYAFGMSTMLALGYAVLHRANIRVDAFYQYFPAPLRALADIAGLVLLLGFIALIAYFGFNMFLDSVHHGARSITPLRTPLAIPQAIWLLGLGFCLLCGALVVVAAVAALVRGDWAAVQSLVGIKSVDEQIHEETDA
jgi:TRAP-type C4-dicarboxylate transport system permease small subunit